MMHSTSTLTAPPKTIDFHPRLRSTHVLVVEDDTLILPLLSRALTLIDPDIVLDWATNADDARSALISGQYDAILADFMLADSESGFSIYSDARELQPDAQFAMMSALPIGIPVDAYGLLKKPFDVAECRHFLDGLLDHAD